MMAISAVIIVAGGSVVLTRALRQAGVLRKDRDRGYVHPEGLKTFRQKRLRFALSGALAALLLGIIVAVVLLR